MAPKAPVFENHPSVYRGRGSEFGDFRAWRDDDRAYSIVLDKAVIAHGIRRWFEIRGELRQEGQRVSRHYYDLHCLVNSSLGAAALAAELLGADCVRHALLFFNRPDFDLASAKRGSWAVGPKDEMLRRLKGDYEKTAPMIFGKPPGFDVICAPMEKINDSVNSSPAEGTK